MAKKQVRITDLTPEQYKAMTYEQAQQIYNKLMEQNRKESAQYFMNQWGGFNQQKENEDLKKDRAKANDPLRQGALAVGSGVGTAGALWGGEKLYNATLGAKEAPVTTPTTTAGQTGTQAIQAVPQTPQVVGGYQTAPAVTGTFGTASSAATPVGSTMMADGSAGYLMSDGSVMSQAAYEGGASAGGTAGGTAATQGGALTTMGAYAPYAAGALGAYDAYNQYSHPGTRTGVGMQSLRGASSGAGMGAAIGAPFGGIGAIPGAIIGGVLGTVGGLVHGMTSSTKGKDQLKRDALRGYLEDAGVLPDDDIIKFSDGTTFDMSKDVDTKLANFGTGDPRYANKGDRRHVFDVDFTNPNADQLVQDLDPLALALLPEDLKLKSDLTGYLYNAVTAGDAANQNKRLQETYSMFAGGNDPVQAIEQTLEDRYNNGLITKEDKDIAMNSVNRVFGYDSGGFGVG